MSYKVFYAFQSAPPDEFGQRFISEALYQAAKEIKRNKNIEVKIDFGMRGTPGTPILIEEMHIASI
jgi:hypothetical protein